MRQGTDSQTAAADPERDSRTAGRDRGSSLLCIFSFEEISRRIKTQKSQKNSSEFIISLAMFGFNRKKECGKGSRHAKPCMKAALRTLNLNKESRLQRSNYAALQSCGAAVMRCRSYAVPQLCGCYRGLRRILKLYFGFANQITVLIRNFE